MKNARKILSLLAATTVFASLMSFSAAALPNSGLDIVPITDKDYWEAEFTDGATYGQFDSADPKGVKATVSDTGVLTLQRNADAKNNWPSVRTLLEENLTPYDMKANPYFYYDFVATGTKWMIQLNFGAAGNITVKLAQAICKENGTTLNSIDEDGLEGTYKGKIDLNKVITDNNISGLKTDSKTFSPSIKIYVVDDNAEGTIVVNSLSIGNDDASIPAGPKLDSKLKMSDEDDEPAATTAANTGDTTKAGDATKATTKAATTKAGTTKPAANEEGDNSTLFIVLGVVAVVVVGGGVAAFMILKKKKPGNEE